MLRQGRRIPYGLIDPAQLPGKWIRLTLTLPAGIVRLEADAASLAVAEFVTALREAIAGERCGVAVLAAPAAVREELAGRGGMHGPVPGLALMRAVKDQFDPGHRMAPGRFPC